MRKLQILTVILFSLVLFLPIVTFNFEKEAASEIDNRMLAENPFTNGFGINGDRTAAVENYVNDRIGLRDEMILAYTVLNDRIFGKMVHPSYTYGKNGYVFGSGFHKIEYGEYHKIFAEMVSQIQEYCESRSVPFLFVLNPEKAAVLSEYLPSGIEYDHSWIELFLQDLDRRGVHYVDNTILLREKTQEGEQVYNVKYDAGHWNDLGAYYGTNNILNTLSKRMPNIHVNTQEDIETGESLKTSLLVSRFPIHELVPQITLHTNYENIGEKYKKELVLDSQFSGFGYYINEERKEAGAPRVLVFQGSYMNGLGSKYLLNSFGEYISIHDYQNVINFPYYFNIFKPECVVFEVADYTFSDKYFDSERMKAMRLNPNPDFYLKQENLGENREASVRKDYTETNGDINRRERKEEGKIEIKNVSLEDVSVKEGETLTHIVWNSSQEGYGWLKLGKDFYDFSKTESGYETTVLTEDYKANGKTMEIVVLEDGNEITDELGLTVTIE